MRFKLPLKTARAILLADLLSACCVAAWASDDSSIPGNWKLAVTSPSEPQREIYIGKLHLLSYANPSKPDAGTASFEVWGKVVYKMPQTRGAFTFSTEILEVRLDCATDTVTPLRDVLIDGSEKTVLDDKTPKKPGHPDFKNVADVDELPTDQGIAFIATDFTCDADLD